MITVKELFIYPLKSGYRQSVDTIEMTKFGPKDDRSWMVVEGEGEKKGKLVSQREAEKLALIRAIVSPNTDSTVFADDDGASIEINHNGLKDHNGPVTVHGSQCNALDAGDGAAKWMSDYLGRSVRLVRMHDNHLRDVSAKNGKPGDQVSFADGAALLVTNQSSYDSLAKHFPDGEDVPHYNFRANIVLEGLEPFEEDVILQAQIGECLVEFTVPCARCKVPTVDQDRGEVLSPEPMPTLVKTRRGKGDGLQGVFYGQNAQPRSLGNICVGDEVKIISRKSMHAALEMATLKYGS